MEGRGRMDVSQEVVVGGWFLWRRHKCFARSYPKLIVKWGHRQYNTWLLICFCFLYSRPLDWTLQRRETLSKIDGILPSSLKILHLSNFILFYENYSPFQFYLSSIVSFPTFRPDQFDALKNHVFILLLLLSRASRTNTKLKMHYLNIVLIILYQFFIEWFLFFSVL